MPSNAAGEASSGPAAALVHPWRGYFLIAAATFCWGAAAVFGKAIFNGGLFAGRTLISPVVLTQTRTTFTVLVLGPALLMLFGRRIFRIRGRDLVLCLLVGTLGVACSNYFYYLAVQKATVSLAITVQYTAPIWVLLYMVLRGREKITLRKTLAALVAIAGTAMAIGVFYSHASFSSVAVAAALLASFGYAFYNVAAQGLVTRNHQLTIMFYVLGSSAMLWLVVNPPWRLAEQHFSRGQWEFFFAFACLSMVLPYVLYLTGLKYLDPTRAVITSCLEPVFAILFAVMFVHETLRSLQVVGILAVLAATVTVQITPPATATNSGLS
ncbi:MAG TPA: DMT family transporter [Candidatus Angelobacter sp.]|nr:DMT family transporter [Candidatus Angelobacter sp.]